jgi:hypothetical protein
MMEWKEEAEQNSSVCFDNYPKRQKVLPLLCEVANPCRLFVLYIYSDFLLKSIY